jgi:spore germination protein GerM
VVKNGIAPRVVKKRTLYFVKIDSDGTLVRTAVIRSLSDSDSPMTDVLSVLIKGPTADEKKRGLDSLIPTGTRLLSATVRGSTAYLSFSEEFQFNTYGVEGYAAQLRQVVWTATEFSNIQNVQILINGRHLDYLGGDGIWIGTPLSRDTL